jgi:hypothetical protein
MLRSEVMRIFYNADYSTGSWGADQRTQGVQAAMAVKKSASEKASKRKPSAKNGATVARTEQNGGHEQPLNVRSMTVSEFEIRQRAYEIYVARGCQDGYDWDDWIQAETEIRSRHKESA